MAENYKHLYEQMKTVVEMYQDELVPGMRKKIEELEQNRVKVVRCKECRDADYVDGTFYCFRWSRNADDDGYCHEGVQRAERSEGE